MSLSTQYVDDSLIHLTLTLSYEQYVALSDMATSEASGFRLPLDKQQFVSGLADALDRHLRAIELQREAAPVVLDTHETTTATRCGECGFFYIKSQRNNPNCPNCEAT